MKSAEEGSQKKEKKKKLMRPSDHRSLGVGRCVLRTLLNADSGLRMRQKKISIIFVYQKSYHVREKKKVK
jgi:hypothetical protein